MSTSNLLPTTQRALQFSAPHPLSTIRLNPSAPIPHFHHGSINTLIRIHATSLNPIDFKLPSLPTPIPRLIIGANPLTPGTDFVGHVEQTTHPDLKPGDLVFGKLPGFPKHGTTAEYAIHNGTVGIAKVPSTWSPTTSPVKLHAFSAIGVAALTALMALRKADLPYNTSHGTQTGGKIFINGGSGGVGTFAVQLAKHVWGCTSVVASCSGSNAELVRSLGADEIIDYRSQNLLQTLVSNAQSSGEFDAVLDLVGSDPHIYYQSHKYLKHHKGHYIQIGAGLSLGATFTMAKIALWPAILGGGRRSWEFASLQEARTEDLEFVGRLVVEGKVRIVVEEGNVFGLEEGGKAFERLATGRTRGKVVVVVEREGSS